MSTIPELIKKKLKVELLSKPIEGGGRTTAGDLKIKDIVEISKEKGGDKSTVKMILGTCLSCGVTIEGRDPRKLIKDIDAGTVQIE